ncbi:hypothetical protein, partial [Yoonia sp.]|uniref:hypothetical protein n=1 Tax=Yoonia sp. TaxID=2212373 RepID=UPI002E01123D|nr:hypothetical protein [Yoonia sp.]
MTTLPAPRVPDARQWPGDYVAVWTWRCERLQAMRRDPVQLMGALEYYRTRPVEFIQHWCDTYDPRNAGRGRPAYMPFIMFKRQAEFIEFLRAVMAAEENGLVEKARDMGATWVCSAFSVWLWLFYPGAAIG